jgi:hypothetical protein
MDTIPSTPRREGLHRAKWVKIGILVLLLGLLGAALAFGVFGKVASRFELTQARFMSEGAPVQTIYTYNGLGFTAQDKVGGTVVSLHRQGSRTVLIYRHTSGSYVILLNGHTVASSTSPLASVSLSPNGRAITYAKIVGLSPNARTGSTQSFPAPENDAVVVTSAWELHVLYPATNRDDTIGRGFAAFFIDDTHLFRLTPTGMYLHDFVSGSETALDTTPLPVVTAPILLSPNRELIAWNDPVTKGVRVYRLKDSKLASVLTSTNHHLARAALSDTGIYAVRPTDQGTQVWKYEFNLTDEPVLVLTAPRGLGIGRLSF